jgi:hypothetical protein
MSCPSNTKAVALALTVLAASCALSGCSDIYFDRRETVVPYAGDAKAINQVTMMVDPWPPHSANRNIAFNGERMQGAVERYRTHSVIRPVSPLTSDSGSQAVPPPDYTTEQIRGVSLKVRSGPPQPQGPAPSPWAGPQNPQPQPAAQPTTQVRQQP